MAIEKTKFPDGRFRRSALASAITLALWCAPTVTGNVAGNAAAEPVSADLASIVQRAVLSNPEVQGKLATFQASEAERTAGIGAYLPSGTVNVSQGKETIDPISAGGASKDFNRTNSSVVLSQMIFDGMITYNDIKRLGYSRAARYFELKDSAENVAAESARLYAEVVRYRLMVQTSEQNYAQHKYVHDQIRSRVLSGVGRRVDLDLATGRMALAESNHLNDVANLHDVVANYQRVVGEMPPLNMKELPDLTKRVPLSNVNALLLASRSNAGFRATMESVQSAQAQARMRQGAFLPRVDFRIRSDHSSNYAGGDYGRTNNVAEVNAQWNFLNGGADLAKVRQYAELVNVAKEFRDKTCRDLRQTVMLAWNNQRKLLSQIELLDIHQRTTESARNSLRAQFDLGQRTLLDLLDTENELFNARRNRINGGVDLFEAQARLLGAMGVLTEFLNVNHQVVSVPAEADHELDEDVRGLCPPDVVPSSIVDRDDLQARAALYNLELNPQKAWGLNLAPPSEPSSPMPSTTPTNPASGKSASAWGVAAPAEKASVLSVKPTVTVAELRRSRPVQSNQPDQAVPLPVEGPTSTLPMQIPLGLQKSLEEWQGAMVRKDAGAYLSSYSAAYAPEFGMSRLDWKKSITRWLMGADFDAVSLENIAVTKQGDKIETRLVQVFKGGLPTSTGKRMVWQKQGERWVIFEEEILN